MNEQLDIKVEKLRPFTRLLMTIGELPTSYLMSMSYLEQVTWFCNYLQKTVIPVVNNNAKAVEELQDIINNLDIQDEVDTKLDEMAESGQLADVIAQYLDLAGVLAYNNISELSSATNITNGSICYTLGQTTYNDGKGAFYKIRNVTTSDTIDGFNIVAITNDNTIIGERLPNYYINQINTNLTTIENRLSNLEDEYTIIIGDSFIAEYSSGNWAISLRDLLGLTPSNCLILGEGGSGFYQTGNQGHTWKTLLEDNVSNIPNLNKVKRIIVGGGTNDVNVADLNGMLTAISTFHTYFKNTFPNAHLYVAEFGWFMKYSDVSSRNKINSAVIPGYKRFSSLDRASYLNTELCYRDLSLYDTTQETLVHPNSDGQLAIAGAINQALHGQYKVARKVSTKAFGASSDITAASIAFYDTLIDGIHTVNMNGNFTLNKAYTPASGLNLNLGALTNQPFIRRTNDNLLGFANIPVRVVTNASVNYYVMCYMNIDSSGNYHLVIPNYAITSNITITSLIIQTTFTFDSTNW